MNTTQFTVVIPLYNKVNSIARTLASIEKQRLKPTEIIIIDDGSSDDSLAKAKNIAHEKIHIFKAKRT